MRVRYRNCREVEQEHRQNGRQYAHTYHYPNVVCLCEAFWDLPRSYRDGILLHEIGHLLVGPEGSEREATEAAEELFGVDIRYVDSEYGDALERLMNPQGPHIRTVYVVQFKQGKRWIDSGFGEFVSSAEAIERARADGREFQIKRVKPKVQPTVADHRRYADLERQIDAMYDREDAYSPEWTSEKFEMEVELLSLKEFLESE